VTLRDRIATALFNELCRVLPENAPGVDCYRLADLVLREVQNDDIRRLGDEDDDTDA
jgi:hypothetical protein